MKKERMRKEYFLEKRHNWHQVANQEENSSLTEIIEICLFTILTRSYHFSELPSFSFVKE